MKRLTVILSMLAILALMLAACASGADEQAPGGTPGLEQPGLTEEAPIEPAPEEPFTESPGMGLTPEVTEPGATTEAPETGEKPEATEPVATVTEGPAIAVTPEATTQQGTPGVRGAEVLPATGGERPNELSALLDFQVAAQDGTNLGAVDDFILNMCEAHILHIVLDSAGGERVLIPYEVVTLAGGTIDAGQGAIILGQEASAVEGAPAFEAHAPDLTTTEWEQGVFDYWSAYTNFSLSSECRVPASGEAGQGDETTVLHKIAYATDVLVAELRSGNGETLGSVEEIVVQPQSGWLQYVAVQLEDAAGDGQGLVLAPVGALNILDQAEGAPGAVLELLVEPGILQNAPRVTAIDQAMGSSDEQAIFDYWSQYVPMTREALP